MSPSKTCGKCFPSSVGVIETMHPDQSAALGDYSALIRQGWLPALCQGTDGRFRVCHSRTSGTARE